MTNEWKEKLSEAGFKYDGHVTHGSLAEQEAVIDQMLGEFIADLRKIGLQCLAGGHKGRNRMFQALANRYAFKYKGER